MFVCLGRHKSLRGEPSGLPFVRGKRSPFFNSFIFLLFCGGRRCPRFVGYHLEFSNDQRGEGFFAEVVGQLVAQILDKLCPERAIGSKDGELFCGDWEYSLVGLSIQQRRGHSRGKRLMGEE